MNPTIEAPPLPPQPNRSSTSCDRHPDESFTGFCPSCLCERLAVLDHSSSASSSTASRKPPTSSTAAAALKAIFKPPTTSGASAAASAAGGGNRTRPTSFFPELRRTKSFSASKNEGFSGVFEPQRKSCDVRVRNTLWNLFTQDDERNPAKKESSRPPEIVEVETRNIVGGASSSTVQGPVFESKEEGEEDEEEEEECEEEDEEETRVSEEPIVGNVIEDRVEEIVEEEEEEEEEEEVVVEEEEEVVEQEVELKPMKDHIDLDSQTKKRDLKEIAGSFWSAASVFSKKLQKWRQKQKLKKRQNGGGSATLPVEKPIGRQFRETQSEIADYGFGRRSCDTDPRFSLDAGRMSLDAGRMSFDDPRYSFDEPRASWDGYLIGRTFPRMPTMVSVVEDPAPPLHVLRSDNQIPVEEPIHEDEAVPGGSAQTRDYYSDSSSRRRRSLDRSNSIRKTAAAVVAEIDEMKSVSNSKVSPASVADYLPGPGPGPGPKLVVPDRDSRDSNSNSLRDDCSETFDMGFRDSASVIGNGDRKGPKKSRRWSKAWNIWSLIHRRGGNKDEDEDRFSRANGVERSFSESWPELRGDRNGDIRGGFNPKTFRSNSSVSWRNSQGFGGGGSFGSMRKSSAEANGHARKKKDEPVLERNRSARYSPNNIDNGLLRFYLTPMRSSRRSANGKSRYNQAHSIARSVLRLY